jgi:hypothetical protein
MLPSESEIERGPWLEKRLLSLNSATKEIYCIPLEKFLRF